MNTAGIIAEYNPFHNGHAYHINKTKQAGYSHIVTVISTSTAQRGEFSILSKRAKVISALKCGSDLVIELPALFSSCSAERFAFGGISILNSLGCVDAVSFGSESGNLSALSECAVKLSDENFKNAIKQKLKHGIPYPKAAEQASGCKLLCNPNDTLGIEYIKSLIKIKSNIKPVAIKRTGAFHDSDFTEKNTASASYIRKLILSNSDFLKYIPSNINKTIYNDIKSNHYITDKNKFDTAAMYKLKCMTAAEIENIPDVTEGLHNRIHRAAQQCFSLNQFFDEVKTKRYTLSRLRRIILYIVLGINKSDFNGPEYIRVLGMNQKGKELLKAAKSSASLPIYTSFSEISKKHAPSAAIEARASDLQTFLSASPLKSGADYYFKTIVMD